MVSVEAVARGLACQCVCAACRGALVAAKGEVVRHHFRHYAENPACREARETAIHLFAKHIICETLNLVLPQDLGAMRSAVSEAVSGDMRFDVLATYESEDVAVEVFVAHRVPIEKVHKLHQRQITAVEIDLSAFRDADLSERQWRNAVLFAAPRRWLCEPAFVRRARDVEIARMEEEERRALLAAWEAARQRELAREEWQIREAERQLEVARVQAATAERCRKDAEIAQQLKDWKEAKARELALQRTPPRLLDLVRAHGGYDRITQEAWARWDADSKLCRERVSSGFFYEK